MALFKIGLKSSSGLKWQKHSVTKIENYKNTKSKKQYTDSVGKQNLERDLTQTYT